MTRSAYSLFVAISVLVLSGCVSSTLDPGQFRPVGSHSSASADNTSEVSQSSVENASAQIETSAGTGVADEAARQQAIREIRSKAAGPIGEKTHIGELPQTAAPPLTEAQQAQKVTALQQAVDNADAEVSDGEIESKQESIRRLRKLAKTHYKTAVQGIEN